jgi:hypothetical protein
MAGAAVGHTAWARRSGTHPRVLAALAAAQVSASVGRQICLWTDKLPEDRRDTSDTFLLDAAAGGLGLEELAAMAGQLYERSRSERPDLEGGRPGSGEAELARGGAELLGEPESDGTWTWLTFRAPDGNIHSLGARIA